MTTLGLQGVGEKETKALDKTVTNIIIKRGDANLNLLNSYPMVAPISLKNAGNKRERRM